MAPSGPIPLAELTQGKPVLELVLVLGLFGGYQSSEPSAHGLVHTLNSYKGGIPESKVKEEAGFWSCFFVN
jgi:hypothetical protein